MSSIDPAQDLGFDNEEVAMEPDELSDDDYDLLYKGDLDEFKIR